MSAVTEVAHVVGETANMTLHKAAPYVGHSAFAHKGGVHVEEALSEAATWTMVMSKRGIVYAVSPVRNNQRRAKTELCPSIAARARTCSSRHPPMS